VGLLLLSFALALTSARVKSATFDEDAYIGKGAAVWFQGNYGLRTAHPVLAPLIGTAPLLTEPGFAEAVDSSKCETGSARRCGRELLFFRSDTRRVLFLVRLPTVGLLVALGALVYHWARELYGPWGGLLALIVYALEPNLLAHGRLLTLDLPATAFVCLTLYAAWRFWRRPGWWRLVAWGVALGLAGATRYTLVFMVPVLMVTALIYAVRPVSGVTLSRRMARAVVALGAAVAIAALTIWAVYGFTFGPVPDWGIRLPAPAYFYDLKELVAYRDKPQDAFLLGQHYTGGWWPYFVVTLAVKTPLPVLILLGAALFSLILRLFPPWEGRERGLRPQSGGGLGGGGEWLILIAVGFYYALSLFSPFNIGHRHLLPILPLLTILIGRLGPRLVAGRRLYRYATVALIVWLVFSALRIYPHFLAYFNELVGPRNGYRVLVDSNLDWGQDLPALERYVAEHDISSLYLSWFGESRPAQYDIPYRFIPSKPDELSDIHTRVYHPDYPPPGVYAISATNLQALLFDDKDLFAWFLQREPVAQVGYSISIYEAPRLLDPDAPPVAVALGSTQIDRVPPAAFETLWRTNDLHLRWFDVATSCILPSGADAWYVLDAEQEPAPFCPLWEEAEPVTQLPTRGGGGQLAFYRLQADSAALKEWLAGLASASPLIISDEATFAPGAAPDLRREVLPPLRFGDRLDLLGYRLLSGALRPGSQWQVVTYWRATTDGGDPPFDRLRTPLKLFVQVLDDAGNVRAQHDGLDVPVFGWREGDLLAQLHTLSLPEDLAPGRYWVQLGVYETQTTERLPVLLDGTPVGTRLLLPPLEVR
jgi:4-amino-4-deoxy-L-arabinose transferase-like glycosyltransferase